MMPVNPYKFPIAVLVSTATCIHLWIISARSLRSPAIRMVTATKSFRHSVLLVVKMITENCDKASNGQIVERDTKVKMANEEQDFHRKILNKI